MSASFLSLVRTELFRYRSRRMIALLVALCAFFALAAGLVTAWESRPPTDSEVATAKARAEAAAERSDIKADLANCLRDPVSYLGPGATEQQCRDALTAGARSYLPREPLDLTGTLKGNGLALGLLVVSLLVIAASAFAGGDHASGSLAHQTLFEPRRVRLWWAKALAVGLASGVVSAVVLGGYWLAMYLVAADRDRPHGSALVDDITWHLVRVVVFATAAAVGAYALTMVFKHSVATLGLLFAYAVGGEVLVALLPVDGIARWSLGNQVFGWLETHLIYYDATASCLRLGECDGNRHLGHVDAGLYLLVLLVVAVVASVLTFRRRDL